VLLSDYWSSFVITGNPNGNGEPTWPVWDPTARNSLLLQAGVPAVVNTTSLCGFWDSVGYKY
jgi:hypothetical protein